MKRILYEKPDGFLAENRGFLLAAEPLVQLNYGNAAAHREDACHPGLLFGRYEEGGEPLLLFGNTLPWNVCLNAPQDEPRALEAAGDLARYLKGGGMQITGVTARGDLAEAFCKAYGGAFRLRTAMDIMVLRELTEPPAVPGRVRKAVRGDLPLMVEWLCAFSAEALHEEADPAQLQQDYAPRVENGQAYLFETPEGEAASMACSNRDLPHGAGVSAVYTPPRHRGKGYCQATVAALCRDKLGEGKGYCTLFVDKMNPVSNRAYKKIGFVVAEDCFDYRIEG